MKQKNPFKEFDERNRYFLKVIKIMPKELQEDILKYGQHTFFISNAIMFWLICGDEKTNKIRKKLLDIYEKKLEEENDRQS